MTPPLPHGEPDFITGQPVEPIGRPLSVLVVGAGARGTTYAELIARRPERGRIVAVAESRATAREAFAAAYAIPPTNVFSDWRELLARPRLADVAIIALQDALHVEAAVGLADLGYQLLLEKPMAPTWEGCCAIADAARRNDTALAVCHVLRYTSYTTALKAVLASRAIGEIVGIEHLEPVGYYHFAHSFVRGNWANEGRATFFLLAKACHDVDWVLDLVDSPVRRVTSAGSLTHFAAAAAPAGAAERCLDCPVEAGCPYSAVRIYSEGLQEGGLRRIFTEIATGGDLTERGLQTALREGPYGRCVYHADNDVVDHQIVGLEFANGVTATITVMAFTALEGRQTKIFGTRGQIKGDGNTIEVFDFLTEQTTVIDTVDRGPSAADGHGGGDGALIEAFVDAMYEGRADLIVSDLASTLNSHRVAFAAEQARRTHTVIELGASGGTTTIVESVGGRDEVL